MAVATDFIGEILIAEQPVTVFSGSPESQNKKTIPEGSEVGRIYSYVQKNGNVYWQIETESGSNDEFVKHAADKLEIRTGGITPGNLLKEFSSAIGFNAVAETGYNVLNLVVFGLVAFAIIKVVGLWD